MHYIKKRDIAKNIATKAIAMSDVDLLLILMSLPAIKPSFCKDLGDDLGKSSLIFLSKSSIFSPLISCFHIIIYINNVRDFFVDIR